MEFKSIDEMFAYVKDQNNKAMPVVAKEQKEIMKEEVIEQVVNAYSPNMYDRTGQILESAQITGVTDSSVETEYLDNGGHTDLNGSHAFVIERHEEGGVWSHGSTKSNPIHKPKTHLVEGSMQKVQEKIPQSYKQIMNALGVPVE
ncbi:hypothetical protein [Metaclostridioides mangenotii]|uniref:hypothetical protein n=1 Tax=Metaclostridioides mangenotii TaxID=1540 RepID=UPI000467595B|nr:hypothetical protein [Clostridioides mangenotii]